MSNLLLFEECLDFICYSFLLDRDYDDCCEFLEYCEFYCFFNCSNFNCNYNSNYLFDFLSFYEFDLFLELSVFNFLSISYFYL